MGLSSAAPIAHGLRIYGYSTLDSRMGFRLVLLEGILYIAGAGIYASRVPERWFPGKYDLVGSSHQVFHLFVVAAVVSHLLALSKVWLFFFLSFFLGVLSARAKKYDGKARAGLAVGGWIITPTQHPLRHR